MNTCTAKTLGELFGITSRRVQQLAKDGVIPKAARGEYEFVGCACGYIKFLRKHGLDSDPAAADLYAQRARLTKEQADKVEMDNRKTKGELVPVGVSVKLLESVLMAFRSRVLSIPTKAAPLVHGCATLAETRDAIEDSLFDALSELSQLDISRL